MDQNEAYIIQQWKNSEKNVDTGPFIWDSKVCTLVEYFTLIYMPTGIQEMNN